MDSPPNAGIDRAYAGHWHDEAMALRREVARLRHENGLLTERNEDLERLVELWTRGEASAR